MYILKSEADFDSAHFLSGYDGKCSNIHGHQWKISAEIYGEVLHDDGQMRGMLVDFGIFKKDLKAIADNFDHALIIEENSLKPKTLECLEDENFNIIHVPFRPTAENFAKMFFDMLSDKNYSVKSVAVYETPSNCAIYIGE
jgi:6-pyruvoyltetrahydropterin/6-carboxytetrahydropterin synthase